jgi:hypothetical protein
MQVPGPQFGSHIAHRGLTAVSAMALLVVQPKSALVEPPWAHSGAAAKPKDGLVAETLVLSDQARRYLLLQYRSYPTEFMGCMVGEMRGRSVVVLRIAPADVEPAQSARTHVKSKQSCEEAGWAGTVGVIHSHPSGQQCWYHFPGTQVLTSDGHSFLWQPYPVDAIMCGDRVVWISRDMAERQVTLVPAEASYSLSTRER